MNGTPRLQSGVIPYRRTASGDVEILLITSRQTGEWQVPKGNLEPGMTKRESAAQEGWEEAGVRGSVGAAAAGSYTYWRGNDERRVLLYPLEVLSIEDRWEEAGERQRRWVPSAEAVGAVENRGLSQVLRGFLAEILGAPGS